MTTDVIRYSTLLFIPLLIAIVSCGCSEEGDGSFTGIVQLNDTPLPPSPGFPTTPATPIVPLHDTGVLITPNLSNGIPKNMTPPSPVLEYLFPIEEGPQLPVRPLYIPMIIPKGYSYQGGSLDTEGGVKIRIANESEEIIFIQAPHWGDFGVSLSGNRALLCSENASLHQLFWTNGAYDYYLIGEQGCEELLKMAGSLTPLDYDTLDCIPYTPADPQDPFPDPERIRLLMPRSWMDTRYPDKYHSRMYDITLTSVEFNASFAPDPRDSTMLRHVEVKEDETVVYLSLPAGLFDQFSLEQGLVRIRYPKDYFVSFTDMESLYEAHFKDPAPPGWKARNPGNNSSKCVSL